MLVYAVDLGSTNTKVVLFDDRLQRLAVAQAPADYDRDDQRVEFDPVRLFDQVVELMAKCAATFGDTSRHEAVIAITGQAESLVLVDHAGRPVRPAISWLDSRAADEVEEVAKKFDPVAAFRVTGEPEPSATLPAVKLRWLARHEPESLAATYRVLMIKDDLIQRLTGVLVGEVTTRGFTYLYDVAGRAYWHEMLTFCKISAKQLPPIIRAGLDVGPVRPELINRLPPADSYSVNAGALDHFCAMVGTGSYVDGTVSESSGTVLSLSMLAQKWTFDPKQKISFHAGIRPNETLLFAGADSGGVALEWFRREGLGGMSYEDLEDGLLGCRRGAAAPMFLPYLTGVNPPDFLPMARGAFLGLELRHDRFDLAYAVEEGIAHLLRRNVDSLAEGGTPIRGLVSTGGGATSAFWSQLKADVCGVEVRVPHEQEATCRGVAALALRERGVIASLSDAMTLSQPEVVTYRPSGDPMHSQRYRAFEEYLERLYVR